MASLDSSHFTAVMPLMVMLLAGSASASRLLSSGNSLWQVRSGPTPVETLPLLLPPRPPSGPNPVGTLPLPLPPSPFFGSARLVPNGSDVFPPLLFRSERLVPNGPDVVPPPLFRSMSQVPNGPDVVPPPPPPSPVIQTAPPPPSYCKVYSGHATSARSSGDTITETLSTSSGRIVAKKITTLGDVPSGPDFVPPPPNC